MKSVNKYILCRKQTKSLKKFINLIYYKMDTMNSWIQKIVKRYYLTLKIDLWRGEKSVTLPNLSIYYYLSIYSWKNVKEPYKNNEFKISASTWNNESGLHEASYSISNIQDIKKKIGLEGNSII